MKKTIANYIVNYLYQMGVTHIYGYPGTPLVPFLEALRNENTIQFVLMRHENAAAMAASAYAKLTGKLGVCLSTSGPGVLQTVCGVMDAHVDKVPFLALTGMVPTSQQGHWDFQDVDQTSMFHSLLPFSVTCNSPLQAVSLLRNAVGLAIKDNCATHLALSQDVLSFEYNENDNYFDIQQERLPKILTLLPPPLEAITMAINKLKSYTLIVIVIGNRAFKSGEAIMQLAKKINAPVITTLDAKGAVNEADDYCLGVLGVFGHPAVETTKQILQNAQCVLAFGVDTLKPFLTNDKDVQIRDLIEIEPGFSTLSQFYHRNITLVGDVTSIATSMASMLQPVSTNAIINELIYERKANLDITLQSLPTSNTYIHPIIFFNQLNTYIQQVKAFVVDTGAHTLWTAQYLQLALGQQFIISSKLGIMGFCLPALIAAQTQYKNQVVLGICGDGGFAMSSPELATAVQNNLPIKLIIFNNGVLQNVMAQQLHAFGTSITNPNFVALAEAYGCYGLHLQDSSTIQESLELFFSKNDKPFILSISINPQLPVPLSKWQTSSLISIHQ
jgi:pyruvate oxidase